MSQAKLLVELKILDKDNRVERIIPEGALLRYERIVGDAVYAYFGVASDPVMIDKGCLEIIDE